MPQAPRNPENSFLPRLPGLDPAAQRIVQDLWTAMRGSVAQTQELIQRPTWTKAQLDAQYSAAVIRNALAFGGSSQLNVNGLPGLLLQPQTALINALTAAPGAGSPLNQTGTLISVNGQLMVYSGTAWVALTVLGSVLQDTHAHRSTYPAANYALGVLYHETDRHVFYEVALVGGVNTWVYSFGLMVDLLINQPIDLGVHDNLFLFLATDTFLFYWWDGAAWNTIAATTSIVPGIYGDASDVPRVTVDAEGRITAITTVPIAGTTGFSGTVSPVTSITVVNGLVTAAS